MIVKLRKLLRGLGSKLLMGLLVVTFGVWGVGDMLHRSESNIVVASVGEATIYYPEYQRAVYGETEKLRGVLGKRFTPAIAKQFGIEQRVLQNVIDKQLLIQEARATGLRVSDADVVRNIRVSPAFQDDKGKFSKQKFEDMLRATGQSEKDFVQKMRDDMAVKLLVLALTDSIASPANAAPTLLAAREEQRNVEVYTISAALVKNITAPSEVQLTEYYTAHAAEFTAPEYRKISYVAMSDADTRKITPPSEKEIVDSYNERSSDFKKPERRKVEQLLFGNEESAKKAHTEIAGGKAIEQVGKSSNILNPQNISIGLVEKSGIPDVAAEQVFALKKGEITAPIKSAFGWHVFHVSDIVPASVAPLAEVRSQIVKDLEASQAEKSTNMLSNKLEDLIAGGSTLAEAAKELGLKVFSLPPIDRNGKLENGEVEKSLPKQTKLLEIAFKTDEKTESTLIAGSGGVSYILRVDAVIPEKLQPFAEVKQRLIAGWTAQEKSKQLAEIADKIAHDFKAKSDREKAIKTYGITAPTALTISRTKENSQKLPTNTPIPPNMIGDIFAKPVGGASEAFALADGSYIIAVVGGIIPAKIDEKTTKNSAEIADIKKQYEATLQNEITDEYLRYLAGKYKISVNTEVLNKMKSGQ